MILGVYDDDYDLDFEDEYEYEEEPVEEKKTDYLGNILKLAPYALKLGGTVLDFFSNKEEEKEKGKGKEKKKEVDEEVKKQLKEIDEQKKYCLELAKMMCEDKGEERAMKIFRTIGPRFFNGFKNSKSIKLAISTKVTTYDELVDILAKYQG